MWNAPISWKKFNEKCPGHSEFRWMDGRFYFLMSRYQRKRIISGHLNKVSGKRVFYRSVCLLRRTSRVKSSVITRSLSAYFQCFISNEVFILMTRCQFFNGSRPLCRFDILITLQHRKKKNGSRRWRTRRSTESRRPSFRRRWEPSLKNKSLLKTWPVVKISIGRNQLSERYASAIATVGVYRQCKRDGIHVLPVVHLSGFSISKESLPFENSRERVKSSVLLFNHNVGFYFHFFFRRIHTEFWHWLLKTYRVVFF